MKSFDPIFHKGSPEYERAHPPIRWEFGGRTWVVAWESNSVAGWWVPAVLDEDGKRLRFFWDDDQEDALAALAARVAELAREVDELKGSVRGPA